MESGTFKNLPKSELAAFRADLEQQARLEHVGLTILPVTDNGDDTVDVSWQVGPLAPAGAGAANDSGNARAAGETGTSAGVGTRTMTRTMQADIAAAIRGAAERLGADVETLAAMAFIESSLRVDASSSTSSAFGLFQFLTATWQDVVDRHGAALGVTVDQRRDLRAQCLMGAAFLQDNTSTLQRALGRKPEPAECYAAHFFGAGTAARLLQGGRDIQADAALGNNAAAIVAANKSIFQDAGRIRTVGEVMEVFETKMATALGQARALLGAAPGAALGQAAALPAAAPGASVGPNWLPIAEAEIGQKEAAGTADNPRIVEYFGATTFGPHPDSVAWCGAFVSFCLHQAGVINKGSARAADWLDFGDALSQPRLGCIAVLKPQTAHSSGHVGFWTKQEGGRIHLLAGNQHDRVDVTTYPESELQEGGFRWPHGVP